MTSLRRGLAPSWLSVSRETLARLEDFQDLLEKWNPTINLVAKGSLPNAWRRHLLDSAQLTLSWPENARSWVDLGSGGGFPGLVVAIIAQESRPDLRVTLVESDRRKATFLSQAARILGLNVTVLTSRAETLVPLAADVVSARALAPLIDLCGLAHRHLAPHGLALFAKGEQAEAELGEAQKLWNFEAQVLPSHTETTGRIITMKNIRHV